MNMDESNGSTGKNEQELRQRKSQQEDRVPDISQQHKHDTKSKKTYGRTAGGTIFVVPQTRDMVSQLFSPSQPKNISDLVLVAFLGLHILTLWLLPPSLRIPTFAAVFILWRAAYNLGIGILLHLQSKHWTLVNWAKQYKLFVNPKVEKNPHPWLYNFMQSELEKKIPVDYKFADAPIEYNTWLVFRRVVDIILLCDFVSYCLFAIACAGRPANESVILTLARWAAGLALFGFNLWVKLDAHRVVKDFAWYWGDFFFLIDQELTFDGVFEMAPHPMYSIGYAGYYGISLMAASYRVLIISVLAHAAQFAFLLLVESPHIEKTYNPPPRRRRSGTPNTHSEVDLDLSESNPELPTITESPDPPASIHNLLGVGSIDLHRVTDTSVLLMQLFIFALTILTPSTRSIKAVFVVNAVVWRLWYSLGIGYILNRQSSRKRWTRHFLKYGGSTEEAWREWKGIYHLSMTLCYASFLAASFKLYERPADWKQGLPVLKHVLGISLIVLHLWTAFSIYDSLGDFGWFFGDFFFTDRRPKLTYNGIYRFLNNPERVIGLAGVWGSALITSSTTIFFLALLSQVLALAFIQFVERPHMQRLYGHDLRQESGLTRSLRRSLPPKFFGWQGSVDKMLEGTFDSFEELLDSARPMIAAGVSHFVRDTTALFKYPARISITRLSPDIAGFDPKDYSVQLTGLPHNSNSKTITVNYGTPLRIKWTAPLNHSKSDWIGLYRVADNSSREITGLPSQGRWVPTNKNQYGSIVADSGILVSDVRTSGSQRKDGERKDFLAGEMEFRGDKLWWRTGVFEFRYHHNGKHRVMAISLPFEIAVERFDEDDVMPDANGSVRAGVETALLELVRNCFDRDEDIAPATVDEGFGGQVERDGKYARRVVYAMQQMFGIEFAPEVVQADGNVRNLAWRVCHAKKALQQYSTLSRGRNSPVDAKC